MNIELDKNVIEVIVNKDIYDVDTIHKCFYWYTDKFEISIDEDKEKIIIRLSDTQKKLIDEKNYNYFRQKISKDIIDFKVRNIISKETKNIRDLLVAKAFSSSESAENVPPGEISDPVGFSPN